MSHSKTLVTLNYDNNLENDYEIAMNNLELKIQKNKNLIYILTIIILLISALTYKFYKEQKKENQALKIKILTLNKKRNITPWQGLVSSPQIWPIVAPSQSKTDEVSIKESSTIRTPRKLLELDEDQAIQNLSTTELADILSMRMIEIKSFNKQGLEKNIEIADEIISREPDTYSAYKAKLISLLILEGKLNQEIEDDDINNLLETMALFDFSGDTALRREAILIRNTTNELSKLADSLNDVAIKRQAIEQEMELQDPPPLSRSGWEMERQNLLNSEQELATKIIELNSQLDSGFTEDQYLNEEIVQIPFLRSMAKEDFNNVINDAENFIEQFPNASDGYYFLIKAYELTGRHEDALRVREDPRLSNETLTIVEKRLKDFPNFDPKKYWENLNF